jgi:alpha/beta superfamily hydrolase
MRAHKLVTTAVVIGCIGVAVHFAKPLILTAVGGGSPGLEAPHSDIPFAQGRKLFTTRINLGHLNPEPVETPDTRELRVVTYPSAVGDLPAYLTPDPGDHKKHPAIIWITGGDTNTIGDVWSPQPAENDQSAAAFRRAGIVTMYPSLRGGNTNPGHTEGFFGEIDDVLAAADYLAKQPYVDPQRIYLGGHSTGGVLALLVAETSGRFRTTFAFGARAFGADSPTFFSGTDFKKMDSMEAMLRAPTLWLQFIESPVFAIEGSEGNSDDLEHMRAASHNPKITFISVKGADHFSVLGPANEVIAAKILQDVGAAPQISLSSSDIEATLHHTEH